MIILRILYYFSIKRYRPFSKKKQTTTTRKIKNQTNQPTPQTPGIFIISGALDCTVIQTLPYCKNWIQSRRSSRKIAIHVQYTTEQAI